MILSCVSISRNSTWSASRGVIYAVYVGLILLHGLTGALTGRLMPKIQTACIYINIGIVIATVIALPVGKISRGEPLNPGSYVFRHLDNETGWPTGWAFMLAWLAPIWSIGSFDSCVHMSEEAMHAAKAVPLGILFSAGSACVLGFLVLAVIAATMNPNVSETINSKFGQPMAQVCYCRSVIMAGSSPWLWTSTDLLRRTRQNRRPRLHDRTMHHPIPHRSQPSTLPQHPQPPY